jgi:hypothetical protein
MRVIYETLQGRFDAKQPAPAESLVRVHVTLLPPEGSTTQPSPSAP